MITCAEPTLFLGASASTAASDVPPRATNSATSEISVAGDGRRFWMRLMNPPSSSGPRRHPLAAGRGASTASRPPSGLAPPVRGEVGRVGHAALLDRGGDLVPLERHAAERDLDPAASPTSTRAYAAKES